MVWCTDQDVDKGTGYDGPKSTSKGVSNECTNEGGEARGSTKVGDGVRRLNKRQIQNLSQVCDQVCMKTSCCKSITYFISCSQKHNHFHNLMAFVN